MTPAALALLIFVLTYLLILSEMVDLTVAALIGALLMVFYNVLKPEHIIQSIDFGTLATALGMMIIVNIAKDSGFFDYFSIKTLKLVKGDASKLLVVLPSLCILLSLFFNNITAMLIVGSLTITLCRSLKMDFRPLLIAESLAANIGALLTPISSLENMMISSVANLNFLDFVFNVFPIGLVYYITSLLFFRIFLEPQVRHVKIDLEHLKGLDAEKAIKDRTLFRKSSIVLALILVAFVFQNFFKTGSSAIAIVGAIFMLVLSGADPEKTLREVQWSTLFYFAAIFVVVGGVNEVGLLETFAGFISKLANNEMYSVLLMLFISATSSSVIDNIPITAALIPVIKKTSEILSVDKTPFWYALIAGGVLGGNFTPFGSPSSIVVLKMAEKEKKPISLFEFIKYGVILTSVHLALSFIYFILRMKFLPFVNFA